MTTYTLTYNSGAGDCYGESNGGFDKTGQVAYVGNTSASNYPTKAWFPFASVAVDKGTVITSATFKFKAASSQSGTTVKIKIGCEAADNPADPTNKTDLFNRVLTTAYTTDNNVAAETAGTEYTFDITTAVQEILNRAGWVNGNKIAVFIDDNGSTANKTRDIATSEHATYSDPQLVIVYGFTYELALSAGSYAVTGNSLTFTSLVQQILHMLPKNYVLHMNQKNYTLFMKAKNYILHMSKRE
jgi:hypothetical protein